MKRFILPLTAFVLVATGYSLHAAGLFSPRAVPTVETRREVSDPFASEAALRHRSCEPTHWRAMMMPK